MESVTQIRNPAVVLGDARSVLQLGVASMKNRNDWKQLDSELLAHFLQVIGQIRNSEWHHSKCEYAVQGGRLIESAFPSLESFVFAVVYFRQLFAKRDKLLSRAAAVYLKFVDCQATASWVLVEQRRFEAALDEKVWHLPEFTARELIEAYMYGAGLMHRFPKPSDRSRKKFLRIHDELPRPQVLYALNGSMRELLNHAINIAIVIQRDFGHWQHEYNLPLPDVRWHDRWFDTKQTRGPLPSRERAG